MTLQWRTTGTAGIPTQSSQMTPLLSAPRTPWQTSWLFTGSRGRWPRWLSGPRLLASKPRLTGPYRARRRGTFLWVWRGSAVARAAPKMILDVCAEAGRRGGWGAGMDSGGKTLEVKYGGEQVHICCLIGFS